MPYRVEISPNNRAGCIDTVCKAAKTKILKGELRFGAWVEVNEHGSWRWKHWGCVSGYQLVGLLDDLNKDDGSLDWDLIDGYDEISDDDVKAKIRRCVEQGHIDAEDFNGDPECNVPGSRGIRSRKKTKEVKEDVMAETEVKEPGEKVAAPTKKAASKRGRKKAVPATDNDDEEQEQEQEQEAEPAKKKGRPARKSNASVVAKDEEEDTEAQPAAPKRKRGAAAAKKSTKDDENTAAEEDEDEAEAEKPAPTKRARGRPAKAKPTAEEGSEPEDVQSEAGKEPAKRGRKSKGAAAAASKEAPAGSRRSGRAQKK